MGNTLSLFNMLKKVLSLLQRKLLKPILIIWWEVYDAIPAYCKDIQYIHFLNTQISLALDSFNVSVWHQFSFITAFPVSVQNGSLHQKDTVHDADFEPYLTNQSSQVPCQNNSNLTSSSLHIVILTYFLNAISFCRTMAISPWQTPTCPATMPLLLGFLTL